MDWPQVATLAGSVIGTGIVLATLILRTTARLDRRIDDAAADRRAFQAGMDDFRREMLRLAERQARLEGKASAAAE